MKTNQKVRRVHAHDSVIKALGGTSVVAAMCKVRPPSVTEWRRRGIPLARLPDIERASNGAVRCDDLRPDVEWLRDRAGEVTGYRVHLAAPAGKGKKISGNVSAIHGADATRVPAVPKSPRAKGRQGEVAHG